MDDEDANADEGEKEYKEDDGELEAWGYTIPVQYGDGHDSDDESDQVDDASDSDEDDPDCVVPDEGEELDDDVYACEGYSAL